MQVVILMMPIFVTTNKKLRITLIGADEVGDEVMGQVHIEITHQDMEMVIMLMYRHPFPQNDYKSLQPSLLTLFSCNLLRV